MAGMQMAGMQMAGMRSSVMGALIAACLLAACGGGGGGGSTGGGGGGTPPAPPPPDPLLSAAAAFPPMPRDASQLVLQGGTATFGSGTPYNDLEYTLFDTDYMEGETSGFDTFMPVDPSEPFPGTDTIKIINAVNNLDLNDAYDAQDGDRIILGTAEINVPFFLRGDDGIDNDYVVISNFD